MAITLEEMRAGRIDPNTLDPENRASIGKQLAAERDAAVTAERKAADAAEAAANRQRSKDPNAVKGLPRDAVTGQMLPEGAVSEAPEGGLEKAQGLRTADAQRASNLTQDRGYGRGTAKQEQNKVVEMLKSQPVAPKQPVGPHAPTASEAISPGLSRSAADNTAAQKVAAQQSRVSSGATAENIQNIETGAARAQTATAIGEATGQQPRPLSGGAGNQPIIDPRGDIFEEPVAGRARSAEGDIALGKIDEDIASNTDRQNRANSVIRQNEAAGTPDSKEAAAARAVVTETDANIKELGGQRTAENLKARPAGPTPVTDAVERAKATANNPAAAGDDAVNKAKGVLDDTISKVDDATKEPLKKGKKIFERVVDAGKAKLGLKGGGAAAASASVDAGVDEMTKDMPDGPEKNRAVRALGTLGKAAGVVGLVDMAGSYVRNVYESDFRTANVDLIEGIQELVTSGLDTADAVRAGEVGMDEVAVELARGVYDGIVGVIPSLVDNGQFFAGEAFDAALGLPGAEVGSATTGLRGTGVSDPSSPEFTGPGDPGELPGRPGERFDPQGSQALDSVTTDPFLEQGAGEGQFNVGLRGNIDAGNATGGAGGFAQRVEESRRSGAYEPVSQARRTEAQEDLGRIKRGTAAIRDLAASRMGVPTQYLDAVRSGSMTPREANLAQAKQNATGNAGGMTEADYQDFQINASKEGRASQEFAQQMDDASIERFNNTGLEVANAFPNASEEEKLALSSGFTGFAAGWVPEGVDPNQLGPQDLQTVKGQYILASALAQQGEGWLRSLMPWKADITADTLFGKGENILQSMTQQGEWFDIGNDNLLFEGRDSAGESVTLTIEPEKLPPIAQQMINQARGGMNIRAQQGLR